jgi:phosphoglycolate phosphatase
MKPFLLFDFDGTIVNSIEPMYQLLNHYAPRYGFAQVSPEDFARIRSLPMHKAVKHLKLPLYKLIRAIPLVLNEYRKVVHQLEPCEGVIQMLNELTEDRIPMALLSSNRVENVKAFLNRHGISCFQWVEGTGGILKKQSRIALQIKRHGLDKKRMIYIGDESRDIQAAQKCGIRIICVTWGFHTSSLLCSYNPDFVVDRPQQIVELMRSLASEPVPEAK